MLNNLKKETVQLVIGIAAVLFGVVGLLNVGYVAQSIVIALTAVFGLIGYYFIFPMSIIVGLFFIFKRHLPKFKSNVILIGGTLILFALIILLSTLAYYPVNAKNVSLNITNFNSFFLDAWNEATATPFKGNNYIRIDITNSHLGGGWFGFFFAGAFSSLITPIGTIISSIIIMVVGFILSTYQGLAHFFKSLKVAANDDVDSGASFETLDVNKSSPLTENGPAPINEKTNDFVAHENVFNDQITSNFEDDLENEMPTRVNKNHREEVKAERTQFERVEEPVQEKPTPVKESSNFEAFANSRPLEKVHFSFDLDDNISSSGANNNSYENPFAIKPDDKPFEEMPTESPSFITKEDEAELKEINNEETDLEPTIEEETNAEDTNEVVEETKIPAMEPKPAPTPVRLPPYVLPGEDLLNEISIEDNAKIEEECQQNEIKINQVFEDLGVGAKVIGHTIGPSITRYDVQSTQGSSVAEIDRVKDDISQRLEGLSVRFERIVRGKTTSGLEIPNSYSLKVCYKELLTNIPKGDKYRLCIPFGKDINGQTIYGDLSDFPHMLIAGGTGSGKSVYMHSVIMTLIMRNKPDELKFIMIDPKRVEFSKYRDTPFLLCPIITDIGKSAAALDRLIDEMERRYSLFELSMTTKISEYNEYANEQGTEKLPYIVMICDEYADLSDQCKNIGQKIQRLAQKARAAGIHLIIATQRPSVNVITGTIKANLSTRVALAVKAQEDSRTVLGESGAETLLGYGDMLVDCTNICRSGLIRCQSAYVDPKEIVRVVSRIKEQREVVYNPAFLDLDDLAEVEIDKGPAQPLSNAEQRTQSDDELYRFLLESIVTTDFVSISRIQREYGVGFSRAGRMFTRLKNDGFVIEDNTSSKGSKVNKDAIRSRLNSEGNASDNDFVSENLFDNGDKKEQ